MSSSKEYEFGDKYIIFINWKWASLFRRKLESYLKKLPSTRPYLATLKTSTFFSKTLSILIFAKEYFQI